MIEKTGKGIMVSGSLAFDLFFEYPGHIRDHFKGTDEEIFGSLNFRSRGPEHRRGGCGGNVALNLAMLGIPAVLDSWIGEDGEPYLQALVEAGVDTRGVYRCRGCATSTGVLLSDATGEQIIIFGEPEKQPVWNLPPEELLETIPATGTIVAGGHIGVYPRGPGAQSGVGLVTALPPERFVRILPYLSSRGFSTIADPGKVILDIQPRQLAAALGHADILVMNRHEYGLMREHLGDLWMPLEREVPALVITDGAQGAVIKMYEEDRGTDQIHIPVYPVPVPVDPYGAGDAFLAGFAAGRSYGLPLETSARIGAAAASFALESPGSQTHCFDAGAFARRFASLAGGSPTEEGTAEAAADAPLPGAAERLAETAPPGSFHSFFTSLARAAAGDIPASGADPGAPRDTPNQGDNP